MMIEQRQSKREMKIISEKEEKGRAERIRDSKTMREN